MFSSNKLTDQFIITKNKLGNGAFGSVYVARVENKEIAVKCESKEENNNLTLLREFKICKKIYIIKKYLKCQEILKINNKDEQNLKMIENLDKNQSIVIYNYIVNNNLLSIPEEFNINYLIEKKCIPDTYSYIECNDFNFLTMDLCGSNLENIVENNKLTEKSKYFLAYNLLYTMSCIHRCGIIHRDIKLSNLVLSEKINKLTDGKKIYPSIIDLGLAKENYKFEGGKVQYITPHETKSITGTLRYISLNVHEFKSPTIIDDLISLCYSLVVIFTEKNLPWIGHKKDINKFDPTRHTHANCKCGYHQNKMKNDTKNNNTIAEIKFHTSLEELCDNKYHFLSKWIKYLYSLKSKQLPSYNQLLKILKTDDYMSKLLNVNEELFFEIKNNFQN